MIVRKSINMASMLKAPVLGVVENMRTMICPHCGTEVALFDDGSQQGAQRMGLPILASLPWRKELAQTRALRWSTLSETVKKDADRLAGEVELALASVSSQPKDAERNNHALSSQRPKNQLRNSLLFGKLFYKKEKQVE